MVTRERRYQNAKGLGESAAVAAACAGALIANAFGRDALKDGALVSRYARLASGSGTRSVSGGISIWTSFPGIREEESYGTRLPFDIKDLHFVAYTDFHNIQTLNAHSIAASSPFYSVWIRNKYDRIRHVIESLSLSELMRLAQEDMFYLNSLLVSGGTFIQTERSMKIIRDVIEAQKMGESIFMTADTGPSIIVMSTDKDALDKFVKNEGSLKPLPGKIPDNPKSIANDEEIENATEFLDSAGR